MIDMKKITALIATFVLLAAFSVGCGQSGPGSSGGTPPSSPAGSEDNNGSHSEVSPINAVNGSLDPNNPITITFYSYSFSFPTMRPGMEKLVNNFNETIGREKGVIVEPVEDDAYIRHRTDIVAGERVSMIQQPFGILDSAREFLGLNAFEEIFPKEELEEHLSHMYENAVELGKLYDQIYGLAFTFSTPILYINGGIFEESGLDPKF